MSHPMAGRLSARGQRGIALVMVIVIVAMLVVIAVPFAMSMRMAYRSSQTYVHQTQARLAARGAVARGVHDLYRTHDGLEMAGAAEGWNTPAFDSELEILAAIELPGLAAERRVIPGGPISNVLYAARVEDEQGKININSASPWLLGNLLASAIVAENVDAGQTDIPVDPESAGYFPPENGILWYYGELVTYRKFNGSTFLGCTRGVMGELPEFRDDGGKMREGSLIIDGRAYLLAKLAYEVEPGGYHYFRTVDELRNVAEAKYDEDKRPGFLSAALTPQEFARLKPLLTVHSWRPSGEGWVFEQPILGDLPTQVAPDSDRPERVLVEKPELYPVGSIVRIAAADGSAEYAMVRSVGANPKQTRGHVVLNKQLTGTYAAHSATIALNEQHPINLNSAPPQVLYAWIKGVGLNQRGVWPANPAGGEIIGPQEMLAMCQAMLRWRAEQGALRNALDLKACLEAVAEEQEISKRKVNAVLINALYGGIGLFGRTAPACYRSGNRFTVEGTGVVKGPKGRELARHTVREIVEVCPPTQIEHSVRGQAELEQTLRRGRHHLVETHPEWVRGRPLRDVGLKYLEQLNALEPGQRLDADKLGDLRLQQLEIDLKPRGGSGQVEHHSNARDGRQLAGPVQLPVLGRRPRLSNTGQIDTGGIAGWMRYEGADGVRNFILHFGNSEFENRIALYYDAGAKALVGELADCTLQRYKSTIRAPFAPEKDVWYHIAFTWKSTHDGHLALYIDGRPAGSCAYVDEQGRSLTSVLTADIDAGDDTIPVRDTGGFPDFGVLRIGNEIIEYSGKTPNSFAVVKVGGANPQVVGRGARGSTAQAHPQDARVVPWGYSNRLGEDLYVGGAKLQHATDPTVFTRLNMVSAPAPKILRRADTTIEVATTEGFPDTGYLLIGNERPDGTFRREYVYYGGKTATTFTSVVRDQLNSGGALAFPDQLTYVIPISLEVDQHREYQAVLGNDWLIAIGDEWIRCPGKVRRGGKFYFTYQGAHTQALTSVKNGALDHPRRGVYGTPKQAHAADAEVRPVYRGRRLQLAGQNVYPLGDDDRITLINRNRNGQREARRVTRAVGQGRNQFFSFETFVTRRYRQAEPLTRMLKFPSGELPNQIFPFFIGGKSPDAAEAGSSFRCTIDEYYSETYGQPGAYFLAGAIDPGQTDVPLTRVRGLSSAGGAIKVGDELIGFTGITPDPAGQGGTLTGCVRGWLNTGAVAHDVGAPVFNQANLRMGKLSGELGEDGASVPVTNANQFPTIGYVLVGDEVIGYTRRSGALSMPRSADGRGAFRGRYGTRAQQHAADTLVLWLPARYPDRYCVGVDTPLAGHLTDRFTTRSSSFVSLGWTVESPSKLLTVHALVRIDGQGRWSDQPIVDPVFEDGALPSGKLLLFTDPEKLAALALFGDRIEVRFLFHYGEGAFQSRYWKDTPRFGGWALRYISGSEILHRETGR